MTKYEVRLVPADWKHPKEPDGRYKPLNPEYKKEVDKWDAECAKWKTGWRPYHDDDERLGALCYEQWGGERPHRDDYMPDWTEAETTHYQMYETEGEHYETCSERTPISPAFGSPEELARWLADNGCGDMTASYEDWLQIARCGRVLATE